MARCIEADPSSRPVRPLRRGAVELRHGRPDAEPWRALRPVRAGFSEVAADAAHSAGCSGHEDRVVVFMFRRHIADLGLPFKDELTTRRARWNERRRHPGRSARLVCFASSRAKGDASGTAEYLWGGKAVPVSLTARLLAAVRSASSVRLHCLVGACTPAARRWSWTRRRRYRSARPPDLELSGC
jgi:hypothetical protein